MAAIQGCDLSAIGAISVWLVRSVRSVWSWGAILVQISLELGGLGLVGWPELGVGLCMELRFVRGLEWNEVGVCVRGVSYFRNDLKVKWEWKWFYGLARNIFGQTKNIFSLTLFLGGAKHGLGCKIFSENHLRSKQTQPKSHLLPTELPHHI